MKEEKIIENLQKLLKTKDKSVLVGIGDDAGVVNIGQRRHLVLTTDVLVEGVHFIREQASPVGRTRQQIPGLRPRAVTPCQIGHKALAVNLSDLAAMGARPLYALVSLGLPEGDWGLVKGLYQGIRRLATRFKMTIIGGNISKSKQLFVDVFAVGATTAENLKLRSTARPGDLIYVTGSLGGAQLSRHLRLEPRVAEVQKLLAAVPVSSMIDISDGLSSDLQKLAKASRVGFRLELDLIPVSRDARAISRTRKEALKHALNDGEDYEILFTVPAGYGRKVPKKIGRVPVTRIGEIIRSPKFLVVEKGRERLLKASGFDHFK